MNETVIIGILGVIAAVLILGPLWRGRSQKSVPSKAPPIATPGTSDELEELELDRAMGRVSESDYQKWKGSLAVGEPEAGEAADSDSRTKAESLVRQWSARPKRICETCGERPEPEARFCSNCGTALH